MFFEEHLLSAEPPLEDSLSNACIYKRLPGVVLVANGPDFQYREAFGSRSLVPAVDEPLETDATFVMASCTKLMTAIATLQCVERGLLELDNNVAAILPELRHKDILTGFDRKTNIPILVQSTKMITLRHLLTHTSGISYDSFNPLLRKWLVTHSRPPTSLIGKVTDTYNYPLVFEPGTGWSYGAGIDWAGKMVERVTHMSLQQYMERYIWKPLCMTSATFRLSTRPDLEANMVDFTHRLGLIHPLYNTLMSRNGHLVSASEAEAFDVTTERGSETSSEDGSDDDFGGGGVYCSAPDFARLLHSLCTPTSQPQILETYSIETIFKPQLDPAPLAQLRSTVEIPEMGRVLGGLVLDSERPVLVDWGLGGMLAMEDVRGEFGERRRGMGSLFWSGEPNVYWWADRGAGMSGVYASQLLPQGDRASIAMLGRFEEMVYERIEQQGR